MNSHLIDLAQTLGLFAGGVILGVLLTTYVTARVRLMDSIATEVERVEPTKRKWLTTDRASTVMILGMMLALLLAGVSMILNNQSLAEQARQDCLRAAETTRALADRSAVYREGAAADLAWKRQVRAELLRMGAKPDSGLIRSTDEAIRKGADYLEHLHENPLPQESVKEC